MIYAPFPVYDVESHIYEPEDALLRHLPKRFEKEFYFVEKQGRKQLICHGVFDRHPNVRVASTENGATAVAHLLHRLGRSYGQEPRALKEDPRDTFHRHVYVAPFYEDDLNELRTHLPVERMLFGSDFPHPEGLDEPLRFVEEFDGYSGAEVQKVFSPNLEGLLEGKRD